MPPLETTRLTKATSEREGRAVLRTTKTETVQKRGDRIVRKTDGESKTRTEVPETAKRQLLQAVAKVSKVKLKKPYYETLLRTLEEERRSLPPEPVSFNKKAAELYEALRGGVNKASADIEDAAWKQRLRDLATDTQRERAAVMAMQLHGDRRQQRQKEYFEKTLDQAFALLTSAIPLVGR